jgi:phosphoribosylglycinamide formyltransferase-1
MRIAVLVSGSGTVLQALLDEFPPGESRHGVDIVAVVCNTPGAGAMERARRAGLPVRLVDHRGRTPDGFEAELHAVLQEYQPDLICLAGFLRILSPAFVARYRGRILNTHPALLPAFGGRGMYGERVHKAVLEAGAAVTGCTIHLVNETPDGGPIVAQACVPVLADDTPERLAARVQAEERRLYPDVIRWWAADRLEIATDRVLWRAPGGPQP